eukprot:Partr_v1_DN26591_c0_g1_i1_m3439 putative pheromone-regulated membrane protein
MNNPRYRPLSSPTNPEEVIEIEADNIETSAGDRLKTLLDIFLAELKQTASASVKKSSTLASPLVSLGLMDGALAPGVTKMTVIGDDMIYRTQNFLMRLSACYQLYGCPVHIIEVNMPKVASGLGLAADFTVFPTHQLVSFRWFDERQFQQQSTQFFHSAYGFDMYKLQLVDELVRLISSYASTQSSASTTAHGNGKQAEVQSKPLSSQLGERSSEGVRMEILTLASSGPGVFSSTSTLPSTRSIRTGKQSAASLKRAADIEDAPNSPLVTANETPSYFTTFAKIAVENGITHLESIVNHRFLYSDRLQLLLKALVSAGCTGVFFNGNFEDMLVSFVLGSAVAALSWLSKSPSFHRVYEFLSAFIVSFLVHAYGKLVHPICYSSVTMSAVMWLQQGADITLAIVEILTRKLASGTTRLFSGLILSALIGFGMEVGTALFASFVKVSIHDVYAESTCSDSRGISFLLQLPILLVVTVSSNALMNTHRDQMMPMVIVSICAFIVSTVASRLFGENLAAVFGAFTTAVLSNLYASWSGDPPIICMLSGLLTLVPGTLAVKGFSMLADGDDTGGIGFVVDVLLVAMSLSVGLFMGSFVIEPIETRAWFNKLRNIETRPGFTENSS